MSADVTPGEGEEKKLHFPVMRENSSDIFV
jgi:hypothetical protein